MPGSIIELINMEMPVISKTIDLTIARVAQNGDTFVDGNPDPVLSAFFPLVNYPDMQLALMKLIASKPTLANVIAIDGDIPLKREFVSLTRENIGHCKVGAARMFVESDFDTLREAEKLAAIGSTLASQAIRDAYLQSPIMLTQGVINLHSMLSIRTACTGACSYYDVESKVPYELSYTSQIPTAHLPVPLTTTRRWSILATATGIQDIVDHATAYYQTFRRFPRNIVMGLIEATSLRNQASTKLAIAKNKGVFISGVPTADEIAAIDAPTLEEISMCIAKKLTGVGSQATMINFIVSDALFYRRDESGVLVSGSYIPAGYYFFAENGFIERAIVPTASNNYSGGLSTTTEILRKEPPQEQVTVAGRAVPLVSDPRLIAARNVENTAIAA